MLNWYKYYSTCEDIREHIRGRLKYAELTKEADEELGSIVSLLYPREED
jgi:predicted nucleic acid-binding OB-fold protein